MNINRKFNIIVVTIIVVMALTVSMLLQLKNQDNNGDTLDNVSENSITEIEMDKYNKVLSENSVRQAMDIMDSIGKVQIDNIITESDGIPVSATIRNIGINQYGQWVINIEISNYSEDELLVQSRDCVTYDAEGNIIESIVALSDTLHPGMTDNVEMYVYVDNDDSHKIRDLVFNMYYESENFEYTCGEVHIDFDKMTCYSENNTYIGNELHKVSEPYIGHHE